MGLPFCIRCGKPASQAKHLIKGLCIDCFLETHVKQRIPRRFEFEYCKSCGSIRIGYQWVSGGDVGEASLKFVEEWFKTHSICTGISEIDGCKVVSVKPVTVPSWRTVVDVVIRFSIKGLEEFVDRSYRIEVYARPTICEQCRTIRGGDYNVLVQIRGRIDEELVRVVGKLVEGNEQIALSIVDVIEDKNGIDIFLLDRGAASKLVSEISKYYEVDIRRTREIVGVTSTGVTRYRMVYSLRIKGLRHRAK
ncbi:MAG TPA: hypothetical protein EYH26_02925 [Pyrodictium sp.]|nr:hypothetical protein [Pyrodictium sp.]